MTLPAPECPRPPPCDCPRRCALAAALAQQPRLSARACPEHTRVPTLTSTTTPACLPHPRPQRACRRPPPPPLSARPSPPAPGYLNDVYRFSAAANTWTALSPSGSGPSPRADMGFAATPDGMIYVFGGSSSYGHGKEVGRGGGATAVDGACFVGRSHAACTCRTAAVSLSLGEGTRVGLEAMRRHVYICSGPVGRIRTAP